MCHHAPVRDVLVVLFWIWVLATLGVYAYRLYRRATQGPKSTREAEAVDAGERQGDTGIRSRLQGPVAPLPDGPIQARLPQSLQNVPPPVADGDVVVPPGGPAEATLHLHPEHRTEDAPPPIGMPRMVTLADALQGIRMPEDLLPLVEPDEPGLIDGRRARFGATGTNVPTVAVALGEELRRLGYTVDGLETISSARAGLTATRDDVAVAAVVDLDDDTGAVVVELNV
jgi:hypothetical protein